MNQVSLKIVSRVALTLILKALTERKRNYPINELMFHSHDIHHSVGVGIRQGSVITPLSSFQQDNSSVFLDDGLLQLFH